MKKMCLIFFLFTTTVCNADEPILLPILST